MRRLPPALALVAAAFACTPPEPPRPSVADPSWLGDAVRACALRASCAHGHESGDARDPARCVSAALVGRAAGASSVLGCMARASSCDAIHACEAAGDPSARAFCAAHPGQATGCDGNVRVECGDDANEAERTDCGTLGGTCRLIQHPGGLSENACVSEKLCPASAPESRCDGARAVLTCQDGAADRTVCPAGTTCRVRSETDGSSRASCEVDGAPRCSAPGARYCEGDRLVTCAGPRGNDKGTVEVSDCGSFGLRCDGEGKAAGCYVRGVPDCAAEDPARCDDGVLSYCAFGRRVRVACKDIGGASCEGGAVPACKVPHEEKPHR